MRRLVWFGLNDQGDRTRKEAMTREYSVRIDAAARQVPWESPPKVLAMLYPIKYVRAMWDSINFEAFERFVPLRS